MVDSGVVHPNPKTEVIAIGETMVLITPTVAEPLETAELFRLETGGAESNVAVHLSALGHNAAWASHLGSDPLGRRVERQLRERGVDTSLVKFSTDAPTGFYFKDPGNGVIYHRAGSAASAMTPGDLADVPFEQAVITHISGITPSLSASCSALIDSVLDRAKLSDTVVSFDVNYRAALWGIEVAAPALLALARRADIVLVGLDEAEVLWGTATPEAVRALLGEPDILVIKDGDVGATEFSADGHVFVPAHKVNVVEAVGAGDAFAAGYLSGYLNGSTPQRRLSLGHDRAALVLQSTTDLPVL
jgi:2-dehydro-3-deoxygluconokinase